MSDSISRPGIRTRTYKSQAIVYFDGDKSDTIFILKKGKVLLTYFKPETGEEIKEEVNPGEFFGVKSALGKYPREETAQTVGESTVLILSPADFEKLVLGNVQVVKKMLRVFSNQLRRIGRAVREVMGESNSVDPVQELYKIAEHYLANNRIEQALYAYKKYMEHYPDGANAADAMKKIRDIESGRVPVGGGAVVSPIMPEISSSNPDDAFDLDTLEDSGTLPDFSGSSDGGSIGDFGFSDSQEGEGSDFGDFLGDDGDSFGDDLDHTPIDDFALFGGESHQDKYSQAVKSEEQGDYDRALSLFESLLGEMGLDDDLKEQAEIEVACCKKMQEKYQEALTDLSIFVKNNPRSDYIKKALYEVGDTYLKAGSVQKATAYLKKVAAMQPRDEFNQKALGLLKKYRYD
jgi:CRP-like cAMP-binding protein